MKDESILANRIYESRKILGVTQETLAEQLGITPQSISRWENGQSRPDVDMLPKLAAIFGTTIDALFGYHAENLKIEQYEKSRRKDYIYCKNAKRTVREILGLLPPDKPSTILEIGCGEGNDAIFFARNGYIVSAFDVSASAIDAAQQLAQKIGVEVNFFCADFMSYKIESNFDIIYSCRAIEKIPHELRKDFFENIRSHTNIGGLNAFSVNVDKSFVKARGNYQTAEIFGYYGRNWKFEILEEVYYEFDDDKICTDIVVARKITD